jgi:CBS domain-containing protein
MDPMEFVRRAAPFGRLSSAAAAQLAGRLEILFFPKGSGVARWDAQTPHVYLIRKGAVKLETPHGETIHLEEGEMFGGGERPFGTLPAEVTAEEDLLVYRWPAEVVAQVRATGSGIGDEQAAGLFAPVHSLVRRRLVWVTPEVTTGEAARRMAEAGVSSLVVARAQPDAGSVPVGEVVGLVTDRDLRSKVLARGLGPDTPVDSIMTSPVHTVSADAPVFAALLEMLERRVHHLPALRDGRVVGMVTDTDLMQLQARSPLFVLKRLEEGSLDRYADEVASVGSSLLEAGVGVARLCQTVSRLHDALCRRVLGEAEQELGAPPVPYAWMVYGSEGRQEQILPTDQDNALVYADGADDAYFVRFAEAASRRLAAAGFPPCPGGYMAVNWRGPLRTWVERFTLWMQQPEGENLLNAQVFFDFRSAGGELDLGPLEQTVAGARNKHLFVAHVARSGVQFRPPLGLFRRLQTHDGRLDLKSGAIAPVVCIGRLLALQAGIRERNTFHRLRAASESGLLSREDAEGLSDAFELAMRLRLRDQLAAWRRGERPGDEVAVDALSAGERRNLRHALWVIHQVQEGVRHRFHMGLWA